MGDPLSHHPASQSLGHDSHNQACSQADSTWGNQPCVGSAVSSVLVNFGKKSEKECMECQRRKATPAKQIMAPLPELCTWKS